MTEVSAASDCPCCSGQMYESCCQPFHQKIAAQTCEQLVRSRYCAYVLGLVDYLIETTHPDERSKGLRRSIESTLKSTEWMGLSVTETQHGGEQDKVGKVRFIAHFSEAGKEGRMQELSRFSRYKGQWVYRDGVCF